MAKRCPRCGTSNRDESRFCLYCGATLPGLTAEDAARPAVTAPISTPSSPIRLIPPPAPRERAPDFVALLGVTNFVVAALRWSLRRTKIHTLGAALGGIGAIALAYLLYRYSLRELSGSQVVSFEAAVIGILLFVYIGLGLHWTSTRRRLAYEAARRSPR